jgi:hypothetical protein
LSLDRSGPVSATLLYSGPIAEDYFSKGKELKSGDIARAMADANSTLAIIDNSHVGRFEASRVFRRQFGLSHATISRFSLAA